MSIKSFVAAALLLAVSVGIAFARSWDEGDIALAFFLRIAAAVFAALAVISVLGGNHPAAKKLGGLAVALLAFVYVPKVFGAQVEWFAAQKRNADIATREAAVRASQPKAIPCEPPWVDAAGKPTRWWSYHDDPIVCYDRPGFHPTRRRTPLEPVDDTVTGIIELQALRRAENAALAETRRQADQEARRLEQLRAQTITPVSAAPTPDPGWDPPRQPVR